MKGGQPSGNGSNGAGGRGPDGRFRPGNRCGRGAPAGPAAAAAALRAELLASVKPADVRAIVAALVRAAQGGDTTAARVILDRALGPPLALDVLARLELVEAAVADISQGGAS